MLQRSFVRMAAAAVLSSGMMMVAGASAASAACKTHSHSAAGSPNVIQFLASVSSKNAWKSAASAHDGAAFSTWGKATNKSVTCKKAAPGNQWTCTAKAKPCN